MIKIGLDLHGVITDNPGFFSEMSHNMRKHELFDSFEIYIVTGREDCDELRSELHLCGMERVYKGILSITTYQKAQKTPITYMNGDKSLPMMDPKIWNPTKAMLCATAGIDIMIDDSAIYEPFFQDIKTQYIVYTPKMKAFLQTLFYCGAK